jgi:hypothetical protein
VDEPEHFNMPRYSEYADYARRFSFAAKFDFRSFYFNNRLHPSLYHLLAFAPQSATSAGRALHLASTTLLFMHIFFRSSF